MTGPRDLAGAKRRAAEQLADLPGVNAVGVGSKEVAGAPTGQPAIKVFVTRKLPLDEVPPAERIPATIDGVPTDVVETGEIHLVAAPPGANRPADDDAGDESRYRPLIGGSQIMPDGSAYWGTLGCHVRQRDDHTKVYALTCYHVMRPPDLGAPTVGGTDVGQPSTGSCSGCCQGTFGKYAGGARIRVGNSAPDRDEALVRLNPGLEWKADLLDVAAGGGNGAVPGIHPVTEAEATSGTYRVRKRGKRTGLTGGILSARVDSAAHPDNVLVINPNPAPSAGTSFFAFEGDSGSVLINETGEVVGLIYARDNAGHGYALMIEGVLARLSADLGAGITLEVATAASPGVVNTVPGAAMVAVPEEVVSALAGTPPSAPQPRVLAPVPGWVLPAPPPVSLAHLEPDLARSPTGRRLVELWREHRRELTTLVDTNRRIATTWHRSGAAALFQLLARMAVDPDVRLPATVHGEPLESCVDRVHAMLGRAASPRLRADLDRVRASLPAVAGLSYPQILDALDRT